MYICIAHKHFIKSVQHFMYSNISPVILSALELEVHFGEQIILNKISLSVHEGDRIGLVGRNGAGKSTFLKIISDLMPQDSGEVAKKKRSSCWFSFTGIHIR